MSCCVMAQRYWILEYQPPPFDGSLYAHCSSTEVDIHIMQHFANMHIHIMQSKQPDMKFVKNFTPPDFQAKNFTPSISPNFNSFSKKKHKKMSENGEIYTAGKNFTLPPALTALTNSTSGGAIAKFHTMLSYHTYNQMLWTLQIIRGMLRPIQVTRNTANKLGYSVQC